jgi:oxaloacetate decarboxylase alpha subunit
MAAVAPAPASSAITVLAPVAGTVMRLAVNEGASVKSGDTIIIIESMKMELEIKSTAAGKIRFHVQPGSKLVSQQPVADVG